jgi:hypothetical protein
MKSLKLIVALTALTTASAFASDAPKADAQSTAQADAKQAPVLLASAAAPAAAAGVATAVTTPVPAALAPARKDAGRSRAEVKREAVEAVRNHENTLSRDLNFYTK